MSAFRLLDAIRGVALGGILLANLMSFFGTDMLDGIVGAAGAVPSHAWIAAQRPLR